MKPLHVQSHIKYFRDAFSDYFFSTNEVTRYNESKFAKTLMSKGVDKKWPTNEAQKRAAHMAIFGLLKNFLGEIYPPDELMELTDYFLKRMIDVYELAEDRFIMDGLNWDKKK